MVTFKYQEQLSHERLMEIARERAQRFGAVVANRGEERGPQGEQVAWLLRAEELTRGAAEGLRCVGKAQIAQAIAEHLEARLSSREEG
jgi:phosphopantothenoylcysteine decarboxylase/phosphopantothenate--cysteine ligase